MSLSYLNVSCFVNVPTISGFMGVLDNPKVSALHKPHPGDRIAFTVVYESLEPE
jgi:hypothetical protein